MAIGHLSCLLDRKSSCSRSGCGFRFSVIRSTSKHVREKSWLVWPSHLGRKGTRRKARAAGSGAKRCDIFKVSVFCSEMVAQDPGQEFHKRLSPFHLLPLSMWMNLQWVMLHRLLLLLRFAGLPRKVGKVSSASSDACTCIHSLLEAVAFVPETSCGIVAGRGTTIRFVRVAESITGGLLHVYRYRTAD